MRRRIRQANAEDDDGVVITASLIEPERFAAIFDRYAATIHRYLARRSDPQVADDLVAETFLAAFRRRNIYDRHRSVALPWLYGIATNVLAQHRRDQARMHHLQLAAPAAANGPCHADQVSTDVSAGALRDRLDTALREIDAADLDVLLLVAQEELTYEQVANALEIPIGTVRSRLHRARRTLREALGGRNPLTVAEEAVCHG
jgi:RNA polymerase sigma-70 factor (ECF subfamily)